MRIAITGHKGQLGTALKRLLAEPHELFLIDVPEYDISQRAAIIRAVTGFRPDLVIHAAACTNVDACSCEPDMAYTVNGLGTQNIALACQQTGAVMLYVSTNEVFDGAASEPYLEFDRPNPINIYGRSKWAGEWYTQTLLQKFYIVRTAWVYAPGGNHFVTKILRAADQRGRLSVVTDEIGSPTYAPDLAQGIVRLIDTGAFGVYHLTNAGVCSRYEFAGEILRLTGRVHVPITPITSDQYQRASRPPLYTALRNFCGAALGITLRSWQDALQEYLNDVAAC